MADKDLGDEPSLEMPKLGGLFRRRKKDKPGSPEDTRPGAEDFDALVRGESASTVHEDRTDPDEAAGASQAPDVEAPGAEAPEPVDAEPSPDDEPTEVVPVETDPEPTTILDEEPVVASTTPAALVEPPAAEESPEAGHDAAPEDDREDGQADHADQDEDEDEDDYTEDRPKREFTLPPLAAPVAAAITGLVVGLLAVGLTYGSLRGCEAIKGTSSCGTPGFFLLLAIMIILVALGSALLGAWKVLDPTSTSFLAVALLAVIALLFLIQVIFSPWMFVVIPAVAVVTYVASQWLTSLFEEVEEEVTAD